MNLLDYMSKKFQSEYINPIKEANYNLSYNLANNDNTDFSVGNMPSSLLKTIYIIDKGIENKNFMLYFQGQYNICSGEIIGIEILTRLKDSECNIISPDVFIPVAEFTEQIYEIEQWIFKTALTYKREWEEAGYEDYSLSINLSSKTLIHDEYFNKLVDLLLSYDINFNHLIFEITESGIIPDLSKAVKNIKRLKEIGIRVALDDFGAGFSSFNHLEKLPIDIVKLDRKMLRDIPRNPKSCAIFEAMLNLLETLGLEVIVEGIENKEQLDYLLNLKCETGQGFLFSKPMPIKEFVNICN